MPTGKLNTNLLGEKLRLRTPSDHGPHGIMGGRGDHTFVIRAIWREDGKTRLTVLDVQNGDFVDSILLDYFVVKGN